MPSKKKCILLKKALWKRKIILSRDDVPWLAARSGSLLFNSGAGIEAVNILDGKSLWKMAKGRRSESCPRVVLDMILMEKGASSGGGLLILDPLSGKRRGVFDPGNDTWCVGVNEVEGKHVVVLRESVMDFEKQNVLFDINQNKTGDRFWAAFGDQVLWRSDNYKIGMENYEWVCTKVGRNKPTELWRAKYGDLGVLLEAYPDGIGIFYDIKRKKIVFPGIKNTADSVEVRSVQLSSKKKVLWSHVLRCPYMHMSTGYDNILRQGDIILHGFEVYNAKGFYETKPFIGLTAQNIHTGKIVWAKSIKWASLLAEGDGRFWVLYESDRAPKVRKVIAYNSATGEETFSILITGSGHCSACEHNGVLALIVGKTLLGYKLPV